MTDIPDDAALAAEFDILARRAGLTVPEDRRLLLLDGFRELRTMLAQLRQPRTAASEPAATYSMHGITRGIAG